MVRFVTSAARAALTAPAWSPASPRARITSAAVPPDRSGRLANARRRCRASTGAVSSWAAARVTSASVARARRAGLCPPSYAAAGRGPVMPLHPLAAHPPVPAGRRHRRCQLTGCGQRAPRPKRAPRRPGPAVVARAPDQRQIHRSFGARPTAVCNSAACVAGSVAREASARNWVASVFTGVPPSVGRDRCSATSTGRPCARSAWFSPVPAGAKPVAGQGGAKVPLGLSGLATTERHFAQQAFGIGASSTSRFVAWRRTRRRQPFATAKRARASISSTL